MKFKLIICLAFLCFATTKLLNAQITIGSQLPPAQGALLDLKENDNAGGATSKRGLLLPRVILTDLDNLYPMYDSQKEAYTNNKQQIDKEHEGLIVYNMNKVQSDPCDFTVGTIEEGVYSWDGKEWKSVLPPSKSNSDDDVINLSVRNPKVKIFYDKRGGKEEPYTCRKFGTAGVWMTMNLRATSFSKNNPDTRGMSINPFDNDPEFKNSPDKQRNAWYTTPYPSKDENNQEYRGFDDRWLKKNPLVGYIYNYRSIMGGIAKGSIDQRQGICPDGWYVPTYEEYVKLRDEILADPEEYLLKDASGNYPKKEDKKFSDALMVHCSPFQSGTSDIIRGYSKSYSDGGFGAFSIGLIPIDYILSSAFTKNMHFFPVNDGLKEEIHSSGLGGDPTSPSYPKPRPIVIETVKAGVYNEIQRADNWRDMAFGYPLRCKKLNDNIDDL